MSDDNFREVYGWASTMDEAKAQAKTFAKRIERAKKQVEIKMPGNVTIVAGMHINLTGFRPGVSGKYKVISVRHTLSRSGWVTSLTGEGA
jgi:phage protein D